VDIHRFARLYVGGERQFLDMQFIKGDVCYLAFIHIVLVLFDSIVRLSRSPKGKIERNVGEPILVLFTLVLKSRGFQFAHTPFCISGCKRWFVSTKMIDKAHNYPPIFYRPHASYF
jgi:hypothetical protein